MVSLDVKSDLKHELSWMYLSIFTQSKTIWSWFQTMRATLHSAAMNAGLFCFGGGGGDLFHSW